MDVAVGSQRIIAKQPSVWITLPGSTDSCTNGDKLLADASGIRRIRIRPMSLPSSWAATTINALLDLSTAPPFFQPTQICFIHLDPSHESIPP